MFLIIVDYKKPLEEVERYLARCDRFESRESCGSRSLYAGRSVLPA